MRKLYKASLIVFLRSKYLSIPYFVMLVLLLFYFNFIYSFQLPGVELFDSAVWLAFPIIFIIAFFIYAGYELTAKMYDNHMADYINLCRYGLGRAYAAIGLSLLTTAAVPFLLFFIFALFMYMLSGVQYFPLLLHFIKLSALYFGLANVIGVMLGTAMAAKLKTKRPAVYSLTVIFILLNTTFPEALFRMPYLLFGSRLTERILYNIKDFVTVVPWEIGNFYHVDPIYGFPMEPIRWVLAVFWVVLPLILICTEIFRGMAKKVIITTGIAVVLAAVSLFSVRGSTLLMDNRLDSYAGADPGYYLEQPEEYFKSLSAGFCVEKYKMDLTISNNLHAKVEVTVDNSNLDGYQFTLYRGYILKSVYTEDGEIPFTRKGDYISVGSLDGADRVTFVYDGKSPKYYANAQAMALPGYFPYYPKPGRTPVWDIERYGYIINIPPDESIYIVNIHSNLEIFCNLTGGSNSFRGISNGLSLFAGMYEEIAEGIYAEPVRDNLPKKEIINEAEEILAEAFQRLQFPLPAEAVLANKKFFQVPGNFSLNSGTEEIVVMRDHITSGQCYSGQQLAESVMQSIIKPKTAASEFSYYYLKYLFNGQDESDLIYQNPVDLYLLLAEIDEYQVLAQKYAGVNRDRFINMNENEKEVYYADSRRERELEFVINEKAAQYLFYESPLKTENMCIFYNYFTSDSGEDYLTLLERIIREELEYD